MYHNWFVNFALVLVMGINCSTNKLRVEPSDLYSNLSQVRSSVGAFKLFLPIIRIDIVEFDTPNCRWQPIYGSNNISIFYEWGSNLQSLGNPWRVAFEAGINDWNTTQTSLSFVQPIAESWKTA